MKILFLAFVLIATNVLATSNDDIIKDLELSNVYEVDWYEAGTSKIAESENQYRYMKVNLAPNKASVFVNFRDDLSLEINAILPCYKIAKLVPYERSEGWGSDKTPDEKILASVFDKEIRIGETKSASLAGWDIQFTRKAQSTTICTVDSKS